MIFCRFLDNDKGLVLLSSLAMLLFLLCLAVLFVYAAGFSQDEEVANYITENRVLQYKRGLMGRFADYEGKPGGRDNNYAVGGFFDDLGEGHYMGWHSSGLFANAQGGQFLVGLPRWNKNEWWGGECKGNVSWNFNDRPVTCDCFVKRVAGHDVVQPLKAHDAFSGWRGPYLVIPPGEGQDTVDYYGVKIPCFYTGWKSKILVQTGYPCYNRMTVSFPTGWGKSVRSESTRDYRGTRNYAACGSGINQAFFFIVKIINWPSELPCNNIKARYICPRLGYAFEDPAGCEGAHYDSSIDENLAPFNTDETVQWEDDGTGYVYIPQPDACGAMIAGFFRLRLYYDDDPGDPDNSLVMIMELPMVIPWKPSGFGEGCCDTEEMRRELAQHIWIDCKRNGQW